ncbi:MAG: ribosome recycling factor [Deltaproteobacteria bacterium]|nr:ribosome recycling factor [Deltaproteobacteria bacterium]
MENVIKITHEKMEKAVTALKHELSIIRTGRASLSILDEVKVDYYGSKAPLNQVANLKIVDPKLITIQPWEAKMIPVIEKAVLGSGIGLNPTNDGKLIRLSIPSLTEDRRRDLTKLVRKHAEEAKVSIRMARRDGNEALQAREKEKELSEDDVKQGETRIQKLTEEFNKKVDELVQHKEKDILSV